MRPEDDALMKILEEEGCHVYPAFSAALVGYTNGAKLVGVYDYALCVHILMEDTMTYEQAVEWMEYNVVSSVGDQYPIFVSFC